MTGTFCPEVPAGTQQQCMGDTRKQSPIKSPLNWKVTKIQTTLLDNVVVGTIRFKLLLEPSALEEMPQGSEE